jgi:hypothetical protein
VGFCHETIILRKKPRCRGQWTSSRGGSRPSSEQTPDQKRDEEAFPEAERNPEPSEHDADQPCLKGQNTKPQGHNPSRNTDHRRKFHEEKSSSCVYEVIIP